jgi:outer membrane receptor protein involved in Fe transport
VAAIAIIASAAEAQTSSNFDIRSQPLSSALVKFGLQSGHAVIAPAAITAGKTARETRGSMTPEAALRRLLSGSGLSFERSGTAFRIVRAAPVASAPAVSAGPAPLAEVQDIQQDSQSYGDDIVVTAQKREESIQDVPIAISAFSAQALAEQKIEGGYDLLKAIPNVTFSKNNYSGYNFSIRGIGTKAVSATSDPGVAVSFNNMPLLRNRLFEQEYFDVERVEVLRGPQGTLYGRNATAGVINMITAKPDASEFEASIKAEIGNYNARRLVGMVNLPIAEDMLAIRAAGSMTKRDGYGFNLTTGNDTDDRDLWSARVSVAVAPQSPIRARLTWEHFEEDDQRLRTGKQLCHRDEGPTSLPGIPALDPFMRGRLSQGCKQGSLYDEDAFGSPNGLSIPFVVAGQYLGFLGWNRPQFTADPITGEAVFDPTAIRLNFLERGVDPFDVEQVRDLRTIESLRDGEYRAKADILAFDLDIDLTDSLTFSSQTLYNKDRVYSLQDYNRFATRPIFRDSQGPIFNGFPADTDDPAQWAEPSDLYNLLPGGIFNDPQIGPANSIAGLEISSSESKQFSQEFRLASSFDGPINFSVGGNYLWFEGVNDYYLFYNLVTLITQGFYNRSDDPAICTGRAGTNNCMKVDVNPIGSLTGDGHNYFRNKNPYKLESTALFGEMYWEASNALKFTAGLRYTDDRKSFTPWRSQLLVPGYEYGPGEEIKQDWQEFTGRLGVDWKPDLGFTDETMVYAFYSHGYKGGGANPPPAVPVDDRYIVAENPPLFDPEYVDAFEIGTKNVLLNGTLILNGTATYYQYKDYQVSKVVDRTIVNENFDADIFSLELEAVWRPTERLRINGNLGYLHTRVGDGERSIDIFNRTQGNPDWMVVTPWLQQTSNCILPTWLVADFVEQGVIPIPGLEAFSPIIQSCAVYSEAAAGSVPGFDPADYPEVNNGAGFAADLSGNELPNAPHWTFNVGAQYDLPLGPDWEVTLRGDYYRQASSYARVYNLASDRLRGWDNANLSLTVARPADGLALQIYAKNIFDNTPITDAFLNSDATGMTTNIFTLDPRLIGLSISKAF